MASLLGLLCDVSFSVVLVLSLSVCRPHRAGLHVGPAGPAGPAGTRPAMGRQRERKREGKAFIANRVSNPPPPPTPAPLPQLSPRSFPPRSDDGTDGCEGLCISDWTFSTVYRGHFRTAGPTRRGSAPTTKTATSPSLYTCPTRHATTAAISALR